MIHAAILFKTFKRQEHLKTRTDKTDVATTVDNNEIKLNIRALIRIPFRRSQIMIYIEKGCIVEFL